jgi:hypothetical protein
MHEDPAVLNEWYDAMDDFLNEKLGLHFHPNKKHLNRIDTGINFTGFIIKPGRTYLRNSSLARCQQKIRAWERSGAPLDDESLKKLSTSMTSYLAMLRQINGYKARKSICRRVENLFLKADEDCTKILPVKTPAKKKKCRK